MSLSDVTDTALIAELRSVAEHLREELAAWQRRAGTALQIADHHRAELAKLREAFETEAAATSDAEERKAASFWYAAWCERNRQRAEDKIRIADLEREAADLAAARDEARSWRLRSEDLRERLTKTEREMLGISHTLDEAMLASAEHLRRIAELECEVEAPRCGDLLRFHDGDLEPTRAEKFRAHLERCGDCQRGLVDLARFDGALRALSAARRGGE